LTDVIAIFESQGLRVAASKAASSNEVIGINDRAELAKVDSILRARKARELMLAGVTILAPETVRIDPDVTVGADTEIEPGVILLGRTRIGKNCRVGAYSIITDSQLADGALVLPHSVIAESSVASGARVGPFTHLRPQSEIGSGAQVGAYVEVKKSRVGRDVKAHHLAYIGDAKLGKNVNFSAGAITANYDGVHKSETIVDDNAFIGSASELIAPVHIGRNAYVAGGSTITDDVPANALAIARGRQVNKPGWVTRRKKKSASRK
jgi:bifunctional UDP-N-acetylglucosamine pyrophosphorylase/glucosamine-1-phosphate N-acetyltransferase